MKKVSFIILTALLAVACGQEEHFLKDKTYRAQVQEQFQKRKEEAKHRAEALFGVLDKRKLSLKQREALEFLYAYMPLCDLADYDGEFFLKQIDAAFKAQDYFHWGKSVPCDIFRHFVLVYRVNNEYLDTARIVFFEELKDRVKGLSMAEAALEVNHWCHEKVTYRATDGRTSAPLALMRTSWGRCGEESTFTVAALRAVGIPARQCYTPRWVHTDDNHAWVEVWVDGKWYYMGACEPEPELNMAWFTGPVKRAMMVHTTVFGLYTGPEEKNVETPLFSRINVLENYAPTREVKVQAVDENGQPISGARVQFKVYNYAEWYPMVEKQTDEQGMAAIISGMGDIMVWADKADRYGYGQSTPDDTLVLVHLDKQPGEPYVEELTVNVPQEQQVSAVSSEKAALHALRLQQEDSIRTAYMQTFATEEYAIDLAVRQQLKKEEVWKILQLSQGNWRDIAAFIDSGNNRHWISEFLLSLSEKDLRDTPLDYLHDHFDNGLSYMTTDIPKTILVQQMLSPRIATELIRPWRSFFQQSEFVREIAGEPTTVEHIIRYVKENIALDDAANYYNCLITPQGVYELKRADSRSRDVFFVALCRSLGIPAQIETATGKPQYFSDRQWRDVLFEAENLTEQQSKSYLILGNDKTNIVKPAYLTHYTLAVYKNDDFQTLNLWNSPAVKEYDVHLSLDEGYYRLMSGSRANDGSVAVRAEYFTLATTYTTKVKLSNITDKIALLGSVDMNTEVYLSDNSKHSLKTLSHGKGLALCFIDPKKEPSEHLLQDMRLKAFNEWGGGVLFLVPEDRYNASFTLDTYKGLPLNSYSGANKGNILKTVTASLQRQFEDNYPLVVYLSANGGILYVSEGYKIGVGEALLKIIWLENKQR
ncbi:MAG: transglutaminase-like domain-containing protein [Bacteroidales bacterium]|nr:transglutaminase-like domain-containing protein [Bacteroidales bacterium]MCL2132750.1 transglutaminase-like domain-containing protein [Bacteroidales bacterium]